MRRHNREPWFLLAVTIVVAGLPRLLSLGVFITGDELLWVERSHLFLLALMERDWAGTYQTGHPGVTTMWLGSAGLSLANLLQPHGVALDLSTPIQRDSSLVLIILPYLRLPVAIVTTCCIALSVQLVYRLLGRTTAWFALALLALDPFYLAHSRTLHQDALAASFMLVSSLSMLAYLLHSRSFGYLLLSGATAALAVLSKSTTLLMLPFWGLVAVTLLIYRQRQNHSYLQNVLRAAGSVTLWLALIIITAYDVWPAMWDRPVRVAQRVLATAETYAAAPHAQGVFFLGQTVGDPGLPFYGLVLLYAFTPLALFGLIATLFWLAQPVDSDDESAETHRLIVLLLLLCAGLFILALGLLGAKKQGRYLLPSLLLLDVTAAWGLARTAAWLQRTALYSSISARRLRWLPAGTMLLVVAFSVQAITAFPHHPYYHTYYNPLFGGGAAASRRLTVGWGEGFDKAAAYLNAKEDAASLSATTWPSAPFGPLFHGETVQIPRTDQIRLPDADYALLYVSGLQRQYPSSEFYQEAQDSGTLEHVVRVHGIDYVWIYRMQREDSQVDLEE